MYRRFYALCLTVLMHPNLIANGEVRQNMPSILNDSNGIESTPPNPSNIPDFGTSCQMMSFEENTCIDKKQVGLKTSYSFSNSFYVAKGSRNIP